MITNFKCNPPIPPKRSSAAPSFLLRRRQRLAPGESGARGASLGTAASDSQTRMPKSTWASPEERTPRSRRERASRASRPRRTLVVTSTNGEWWGVRGHPALASTLVGVPLPCHFPFFLPLGSGMPWCSAPHKAQHRASGHIPHGNNREPKHARPANLIRRKSYSGSVVRQYHPLLATKHRLHVVSLGHTLASSSTIKITLHSVGTPPPLARSRWKP